MRFRSFITVVFAVLFAATMAAGQIATGPVEKTGDKKATAKPAPTPDIKAPAKPLTAEQIVDSTLFIYGFGGGRATLNQIRKTTFERGKTSLTGADGKVEQVSYQRFIIRADTLDKEKIRLDQDFSSSRYALVKSDENKVYGVFNNTVFNPRADAVAGFENSIYHGIEALFRYKENGSKLELAGREKQMGVELFMVDVTDNKDRKTRFYISVKTLRVMMLSYEEVGVKYKRRFYDQKYAQGTLVPYRSVLTANDAVVEEQEVSSVTFGQKVDEDLFKAN
ncbi:MAG: hypothetical protein ABJA02_01210 [Acidobacteriota bacterium]